MPYGESPQGPSRTVWLALAVGVFALCCFASFGLTVLGVYGFSTLSRTATARVLQEASPVREETLVLFEESPTATPRPSLTPSPSVTPSNTPSPTPYLGATWYPCLGLYPSRLRVGDRAMVSLSPPLPNRLRREASKGAEVIALLQPGEKVEILGGPACASQMIWWQVRSLASGLSGWTAEGDGKTYWLVPLEGEG